MQNDAEVIRSRQNKAVSEMEKLTDRKEREARRLFRFDGVKLLEEAVRNGVSLATVFFKESEAERVRKRLEDKGIPDLETLSERVSVLENSLFDRISEEKSPEGVICSAKYIDKSKKIATIYNESDFLEMSDEYIVFAESVRDPSNVGAMIRTAAAMGVDRLILSRDCADIYHPKTVRASMGTLFNQKIDLVEDLPSVIRQFTEHGRRVFAAALNHDAQKLGTFERLSGDCVVIGNEGHGLSGKTLTACSHCVFIPMTERAESLNAAVAASILMWEFSKKTF